MKIEARVTPGPGDPPPREDGCGQCHVCCVNLNTDWARPGEPCSHLDVESGCTVYADRPGVCRDYRCAWLFFRWAVEFRPDLCGVGAHVQSGPGEGDSCDGEYWVAVETWDGASREPKGEAVVACLLDTGSDVRVYSPTGGLVCVHRAPVVKGDGG